MMNTGICHLSQLSRADMSVFFFFYSTVLTGDSLQGAERYMLRVGPAKHDRLKGGKKTPVLSLPLMGGWSSELQPSKLRQSINV